MEVKYVEEVETFRLGKKECAGAVVSYQAKDQKTQSFLTLIPGKQIAFMVICTVPEEKYNNFADDFYSMLGSARFE